MLRLSFVFSSALILAANANNAPLGAQTVASQGSAQKAVSLSPPVISSYKYAKRDWDALTSELQTNKPPSDAQIDSFVMAMIEHVPDSGMQSPDDAVSAGVSVCSANFFQISDSDGEILIASIDVNGRHFCNNVEVIHRGANGLMVQEIDVWEVDDVNDIVRDPGKDGKNELVVPTAYSDYNGAECLATWSRIYTLQSGTLVDRSAAFLQFYKERLDSLEASMQKAINRDDDDNQDRTICAQMEADKIARFLGTAPNAGKDKAIEWINSADQSLRIKGIVVLADIGDKQSIETLQHLAEDSNAIVADAAKRALDRSLGK